MQATPPALPSLLAPVAPGERLQTLDVLRGFALLGILLMNIEAFVGPLFGALSGLDPALTGTNRVADALIYIFVQGKFWTLFSLLFGMGFAVMSERASAAGRPFAGIYWRRGLALLGIGLVHAVLIWSGDILVSYAIVSFLLLAFRPLQGRWLVVVAVLAYLAPLGLMLAFGLLAEAMQAIPEAAGEWNRAMAQQGEEMAAMLEAQRQAYGSGTYLEATAQRLSDLGFMLMNLVFMGPMALGMFLLGSWMVKSGAVANPGSRPALFARLRWVALPIGLAVMLVSFWLQPTLDQSDVSLRFAVAFCLAMIGSAMMSLGYMAWIVRGVQGTRSSSALACLAPVGRMALTNYLLQSLVCTLVFYGYGLGYFEQLSRAWQVPFVLVVFALQVVLSRWWLQRFRFGPMEWVWRTLTYLRPQPMRVATPA